MAGSDRLRVEDIENKRTQLLTTHALNLVTVQPKPGEIVVTVAGSKRQAVSLWELWSRRELNRNVAGVNTSFLLGLQEINGALLYLNLGAEFGGLSSHEPHSLVAGATGSGKSVLIQALLLDIAATNSKDLAQIILIDPKMGVDYAPLADLPHMRDEIVTTKEKAGEVLKALVQEMEDRYRAFAKARARDLPAYNSKVSACGAAADGLPGPRRVRRLDARRRLQDGGERRGPTSRREGPRGRHPPDLRGPASRQGRDADAASREPGQPSDLEGVQRG